MNVDVLFSGVSSLLTGARGLQASRPVERVPEAPPTLYEFEDCPFCRRVRQGLTVLDLDALIRPCPKGGTRFRPEVRERGGKAQFPYLVDPNTGSEMYESADILKYLSRTYGRGDWPLTAVPAGIELLGGSFASLVRLPFGPRGRSGRLPEQPLVLWSFEASPFCRLPREALSALEIPYILRSLGKGSRKRPDFEARHGKVQVPFLEDPNTGRSMFESRDIVNYLVDTYG